MARNVTRRKLNKHNAAKRVSKQNIYKTDVATEGGLLVGGTTETIAMPKAARAKRTACKWCKRTTHLRRCKMCPYSNDFQPTDEERTFYRDNKLTSYTQLPPDLALATAKVSAELSAEKDEQDAAVSIATGAAHDATNGPDGAGTYDARDDEEMLYAMMHRIGMDSTLEMRGDMAVATGESG